MRRTTLLALTLAGTFSLAACGGGGDPLGDADDDGGTQAGADGTGDAAAAAVTIGSANFPENELLAQIYAAALTDAGVEVATTLNIGSRETYMAAIEDGSIDLLPEYTGGLATYLNPELTETSSEDVLAQVEQNLPEGLQVLQISEAENRDSLVVTAETAQELGLTTMTDLEPHAADLVLGGPPEFESRPNGVAGLQSVYGLEFAGFRSLAAGSTLTVQSLVNGQVDVANIFTTDPAIGENDFVVLEDPESLFAAQNIVPLVREDAVNVDVEEALNAVSAALSTENLTAMMVQVITDGQDPAEVARQFVEENLD